MKLDKNGKKQIDDVKILISSGILMAWIWVALHPFNLYFFEVFEYFLLVIVVYIISGTVIFCGLSILKLDYELYLDGKSIQAWKLASIPSFFIGLTYNIVIGIIFFI